MDTRQEAANDDALQPPPRKGGFAGVFQRVFMLRREQAPAPFRESDFESSEWGRSGFGPTAASPAE